MGSKDQPAVSAQSKQEQVERAVEAWFVEHICNSPVAQEERAFKAAQSAKVPLVAAILALL